MCNKQGYEKLLYSTAYISTTIQLDASELSNSESSVSEEFEDSDEIWPISKPYKSSRYPQIQDSDPGPPSSFY